MNAFMRWMIHRLLPGDRRSLRAMVRRMRRRPAQPMARRRDDDVLPPPDPRVHRAGSIHEFLRQNGGTR